MKINSRDTQILRFVFNIEPAHHPFSEKVRPYMMYICSLLKIRTMFVYNIGRSSMFTDLCDLCCRYLCCWCLRRCHRRTIKEMENTRRLCLFRYFEISTNRRASNNCVLIAFKLFSVEYEEFVELSCKLLMCKVCVKTAKHPESKEIFSFSPAFNPFYRVFIYSILMRNALDTLIYSFDIIITVTVVVLLVAAIYHRYNNNSDNKYKYYYRYSYYRVNNLSSVVG